MSSCGVVVFVNGVAQGTEYFGTSWGGQMMIWTALFDKYMKDRYIPYDSVLSLIGKAVDGSQADRDRISRFYNLHEHRPEMLKCEIACQLSSMDHAVVMAADFAEFCADLREFVRLFGLTGREQLSLWAEYISALPAGVDAVAFHGTTIVANPWFTSVALESQPQSGEASDADDNTDEPEPVGYSLTAGSLHFDVYEAVRSRLQANADAALENTENVK